MHETSRTFCHTGTVKLKKTCYLKFRYLLKSLADFDDIYEAYQEISQLFLEGKNFLEYSSFVEISAKNGFFQLWENPILVT